MTRHGTHAVVLGASMAGLVHAVPLARRFDRVTLVDRDVLPEQPEQRRGVPQGSHVHLLVPVGWSASRALPGLLADMSDRGVHVIAAPEWRFHMGGDQLNLTDAGVRITGATRPLLEGVVRDRVLALDGVELLDGWAARDLTTTDDRRRVTGVRLRSEADPEQERRLDADLVIDTMGRGSMSPRWLADLGYAPPEEERLRVDVHHTTRMFRRDPADLGGCRHVLVDIPPGGTRGGVALAVEEGRWLVTLIGMLGERPPRTRPGSPSTPRASGGGPPRHRRGGHTDRGRCPAGLPGLLLAPVRPVATSAGALRGQRRRGLLLRPALRAGDDRGDDGGHRAG